MSFKVKICPSFDFRIAQHILFMITFYVYPYMNLMEDYEMS